MVLCAEPGGERALEKCRAPEELFEMLRRLIEPDISALDAQPRVADLVEKRKMHSDLEEAYEPSVESFLGDLPT